MSSVGCWAFGGMGSGSTLLPRLPDRLAVFRRAEDRAHRFPLCTGIAAHVYAGPMETASTYIALGKPNLGVVLYRRDIKRLFNRHVLRFVFFPALNCELLVLTGIREQLPGLQVCLQRFPPLWVSWGACRELGGPKAVVPVDIVRGR